MRYEWFQTELTHCLSFACYSQKERSSKQKDKCNPRGSKCLARERDSASLILASSSARLLVSPSDDNPWGFAGLTTLPHLTYCSPPRCIIHFGSTPLSLLMGALSLSPFLSICVILNSHHHY